jgi:hypothetical protein
MRAVLLPILMTGLLAVTSISVLARLQAPQKSAISESKDTPAAELTRTTLLKVKVGGEFKDVRLGDILKEFAAQVEMKVEQPLLWNYATGFPFATKVSFTAKDQPLDRALDELLSRAGDGLGYVVVAKDGDKYDGWVRLTTAGERGMELPPPTAAEERVATERLALAKKLIDAGKPSSAKPLLEILVKKYAATKAGMEAKELLEKIDK